MDEDYRSLERRFLEDPTDLMARKTLDAFLDRSGTSHTILQAIRSRLETINGTSRRGVLDLHSIRRLLDHLLLGDSLWAHIVAPGNTPPIGTRPSLRVPHQRDHVRRRTVAFAVRDTDPPSAPTVHLVIVSHPNPPYRPDNIFPRYLTPYPWWADLDVHDLQRTNAFAGSPSRFTTKDLPHLPRDYVLETFDLVSSPSIPLPDRDVVHEASLRMPDLRPPEEQQSHLSPTWSEVALLYDRILAFARSRHTSFHLPWHHARAFARHVDALPPRPLPS